MSDPKNNIVLVGMMGCGKSVTAKALAMLLAGWNVVEADALIEEQEQMSIISIFEKYGESYFRTKETELVKKISSGEHQIVSTGGGMYINDENKRILKDMAYVVYLSAKPETVCERVKEDDSRPLLKNKADLLEHIKGIIEKRHSHYQQADLIIETDGKTAEEVAGRILEEYLKNEN